MVAKGRKQLVGLLTDDPKVVLQEGAQIVADPNQPKPMTMLGHVTSSYWSEALGRSIAMAVVVDGHDREGETLHIPMPDRTLTARVVKSTVFLRPREHPAQRLRMESSMNAMTAPFAAGVTITELAPTTRISLRLADPGGRSASSFRPTIGTRSHGGRAHRPLPRPRRVADRGAGSRRAPR